MAASAYSKAAKRQAKRGRPKKEGVLRESNGRASRAKEPPEKVALAARMKHFNITKEAAMDQRAGTYLSRLAMAGRAGGLSDDQYEAALRYLEIRNDHSKALQSSGAYYEPTGSVDSSDPVAYAEWYKRIKHTFDKAQKAISDAQLETKSDNLYAAVQYVIIGDQDFPHLLGATRIVCNALHRHFTLDNKTKSPNK